MKTLEAINVRYIYSACIITSTPDISILHDPWFTDGIYDGSWFQFPKVENPLATIGDVDYIYVSHIHPDHYDSNFLKRYFKQFGVKRVLIADHAPNYLARKMQADGIEPTILTNTLTKGRTTIEIIPHRTGSISDIDSAIIVKYTSKSNRTHCVVNTNDIRFDENTLRKLKEVANNIDILLCGFTGAGPYPQTYFRSFDERLAIEAEIKKNSFLDHYKFLTSFMGAKVNIPFAGKYILGGKLADLNDFRGVADATEALAFDSKAVVLADNGGEIDTEQLTPIGERINCYDLDATVKRIEEIKSELMDYERLLSAEEVHQLPLERLLVKASRSAISKSECVEDYYFCIELPNQRIAVLNANKNGIAPLSFFDPSLVLPTPRSEIIIDPRYLFGLLSGIYHWNNAEIGSQYRTRRIPNCYNKNAQSFLNYLTI